MTRIYYSHKKCVTPPPIKKPSERVRQVVTITLEVQVIYCRIYCVHAAASLMSSQK